MKQSVVIFIEPSENSFLTPLKIGNLFLNRFGIDEDAGFEILGIHFLHRTSRNFADQNLPYFEFLIKRDQKGRELNFTVQDHNYQFDVSSDRQNNILSGKFMTSRKKSLTNRLLIMQSNRLSRTIMA